MMEDVGSAVGASSIIKAPDQALVGALGRYLGDYLMSMYSICPGKKAVSIRWCWAEAVLQAQSLIRSPQGSWFQAL